MKTTHFSFSAIQVISLAILLILSSCVSLNHLNEAQDAFSKGAELENEQLFPGVSSDGGQNLDISRAVEQEMTNLSPSFYYTQSYAAIRQALEDEKSLQQDDLLGNALALKALCEWKLKKYGQARLTAEAAHSAFRRGNIPSPRDQAVMIALEGFIENDLAFNALGKLQREMDQKVGGSRPSSSEINQLFDEMQNFYRQNIYSLDGKAHLMEAIKIIEEAREEVSPNHPVQTYLLMSQLVCVKNWSDALSEIDRYLKKLGLGGMNNEARRWWTEEEERYNGYKTNYLEQLSNRLPGGDQNRVYSEWELILF